jgi:acetyl esterase/lipase
MSENIKNTDYSYYFIDVNQFNNKFLDIEYTNKPSSKKLDIFLPENTKGPFPLIIYIHGGGWMLGHKLMGHNTAVFKAISQGYAVATIDYRLSDEAIWPAQLYDCKAAVRFLKANASKFNINPNKIAAWGNSAGAHLAQMLGATGNIDILEDLSMGNENFSSSVQAVISVFGVSNFLTLTTICNSADKNSPEFKLMGCDIIQNPIRAKEASPIEYITNNIPPYYITHGTGDTIVPYTQSIELYEKIVEIAGENRACLKIIEGACHSGEEFKTNENVNNIIDFLDKNLLKYDNRDRNILPEIKIV